MAGLLTRTKFALGNCKEHIASLPCHSPDVENYLTQHLLVLMCADVQLAIGEMLDDRTKGMGDADLSRFVSQSGRRVVRGVDKSELAGFVAMFGSEKKAQFDNMLTDEDVSTYGIAVTSRHQIAHSQGTNITFRELERAVDAACKVVNAARVTLGLTAIVPDA